MTRRGLVEREAISWHISWTAFQSWEHDRMPLTKAHLVYITPSPVEFGDSEVTARYVEHQPVCGAPVMHYDMNCAMAPEGFPKCKKCSRKPSPVEVPDVFLIEGL